MNTLDLITTISLISGIASIIIAIMAMWLSVVFYRLSSKASEHADSASEEIHSSVQRLEQVFDRLYSDTFSIMRDTVSDMRQHIWSGQNLPSSNVETKAREKTEQRMDELKAQMDNELSKMLEKVSTSNSKLDIQKDVKPLINRAITESTKIAEEVQRETLLENLRSVVTGYAKQQGEPFATASVLIRKVQSEYPEYGFVEILKGLRDLKVEGLLDWRGNELSPGLTVRILDK